jgi:hypothetical protein
VTGGIPRDFLRASMLDSGTVPPASVVRVRPTVRTADSIPAVSDMILFGLMLVTIEIRIVENRNSENRIIESALPALRANRGGIELLIRAAANEFGAIDDPDPARRRNLRYNGMYLERRPPPLGMPILRVTFSGKSGRLLNSPNTPGTDPGVMTPSLVPAGVTRLREVIDRVVLPLPNPVPPSTPSNNWAPTVQLHGAMNVLLDPTFGYHQADQRTEARVLSFDPLSPLDPP